MVVAMIEGTFRIVHRDSNDNTIAELLEKHSNEFAGAVGAPQTDPQKMPKVKKQLSTVLKQDDKLVVMLKPSLANAGANTLAGKRYMRVPVTFRNVRSGVVYEKTLVNADFTDKKDVGAGGVAGGYVVGTWYDVESYNIPAQSEVKLGHAIQDVRVDSALYMQRECDPV